MMLVRDVKQTRCRMKHDPQAMSARDEDADPFILDRIFGKG